MLKFNDIRIRVGAAIVLALLPFLRVSAQEVIPFNEEDLSFKDRIAIRTNVVGWVLTTPNIAFDYDVVNTPYDKRTIGLSLKCNWNTSHSRRLGFNEPDWTSHAPNWVYNLFGARFDYRFYWRQQPYDNRDNFYGDWEREWINSSKGLDKLRARLNCFRASEKPKSHISIFAGPYFSVGGFRVKFPTGGDFKTGEYSTVDRNGFYVGAGATGGIALPLYGYENGAAIDLEFGGCIGLQYAHFKKTIDSNEPLPRNSFLPLVTDARLSLVYRFRSISKQHTEIDYALIDRRYVARLMELDRETSLTYNDSIRALKDELDLRNHEIALYKQSVESLPEFNKAYALEYLTPYVYMMEAPQKYTRYNKDTLPKIHIDSIEQIVDPILLSVREELDSIPHVTSVQIDKEFINQYNNISDADGKMVNRTALIREIYTRLNSYIEDNNSKLVASTFGKDVYSEKLNKYNVKQQGRLLVEIIYKDSVRTVEMTSNDKIEWLNNIKKQAWADAQKRMSNNHPGRVELPEVFDFLAPDPVNVDSVMTDSMMLDSMRLDSMRLDSMKLDSLFVGVALSDSLVLDSLASDSLLVDSLHQIIRADEVEAKVQKKESRRASKDKSNAKAEKRKKSKKSAGKTNQLEELKDSVAVLTDSIVLPMAVTDSAIVDIVPDTALQTIRSDKSEKKSKKAAKTQKEKKVEVIEKIEGSTIASETKVADAVEADSEKVDPEKTVKTKKSEKKGKSKDVPEAEEERVKTAEVVDQVEEPDKSEKKSKKAAKTQKEKKVEVIEKIEGSTIASETKVTDAVEANSEKVDPEKTKKSEKKGKSKDVPEAEEERVKTAEVVDQVEEPEKGEKTKKAEKEKKSKKSKTEVSDDMETVDSVAVDNSVVETMPVVKEDED